MSARVKHVWVGAFTHPFLDILTGFETGWGMPLVEPSALGWFPVVEPVLLDFFRRFNVDWCLEANTARVSAWTRTHYWLDWSCWAAPSMGDQRHRRQ